MRHHHRHQHLLARLGSVRMPGPGMGKLQATSALLGVMREKQTCTLHRG